MLLGKGRRRETARNDRPLYRDDAYLAETAAVVRAAGPAGVELDRTVFYASSGGQPGDTGRLDFDGGALAITGTVHPEGDRARILHLVEAAEALPEPGAAVRLALDWERRYRLMRMHSALHLLSVVLPYRRDRRADRRGQGPARLRHARAARGRAGARGAA